MTLRPRRKSPRSNVFAFNPDQLRWPKGTRWGGRWMDMPWKIGNDFTEFWHGHHNDSPLYQDLNKKHFEGPGGVDDLAEQLDHKGIDATPDELYNGSQQLLEKAEALRSDLYSRDDYRNDPELTAAVDNFADEAYLVAETSPDEWQQLIEGAKDDATGIGEWDDDADTTVPRVVSDSILESREGEDVSDLPFDEVPSGWEPAELGEPETGQTDRGFMHESGLAVVGDDTGWIIVDENGEPVDSDFEEFPSREAAMAAVEERATTQSPSEARVLDGLADADESAWDDLRQDLDVSPITGGSATGARARQKLMDSGFTEDEAEYLTGLITEDELLEAQSGPSEAMRNLMRGQEGRNKRPMQDYQELSKQLSQGMVINREGAVERIVEVVAALPPHLREDSERRLMELLDANIAQGGPRPSPDEPTSGARGIGPGNNPLPASPQNRSVSVPAPPLWRDDEYNATPVRLEDGGFGADQGWRTGRLAQGTPRKPPFQFLPSGALPAAVTPDQRIMVVETPGDQLGYRAKVFYWDDDSGNWVSDRSQIFRMGDLQKALKKHGVDMEADGTVGPFRGSGPAFTGESPQQAQSAPSPALRDLLDADSQNPRSVVNGVTIPPAGADPGFDPNNDELWIRRPADVANALEAQGYVYDDDLDEWVTPKAGGGSGGSGGGGDTPSPRFNDVTVQDAIRQLGPDLTGSEQRALSGLEAALREGDYITARGIAKANGWTGVVDAIRELEVSGNRTASAGKVADTTATLPSVEMFRDPRLTKATPLTVTPDGRVYGHIALWDSCHIGNPEGPNRCTAPPRSATDYAYFHVGAVMTKEGNEVAVGKLVQSTTHASTHDDAMQALAHYENTGLAVADVRAGEDAYGIWVSGTMRQNLTPEQLREFRAAPMSGDWRRIRGNLELIAALAVNIPGYPVPRPKGFVASGFMKSLVASGMVPPQRVKKPGTEGALSEDDIKYLKSLAAKERANHAAQLAAQVQEVRLQVEIEKIKKFAASRRMEDK